MTHDHDLPDAEVRALLRATDASPALDDARAAALAARIVTEGAGWLALHADAAAARPTDAALDRLAARITAQGAGHLALHAEGARTQPDDAALDALAERIAWRARPVLAQHARGARARAPWVAVAARWSRPALPIAIAAGIGALAVLLNTPRTAVSAATVAEADVSSAYDVAGGTGATLAVATPEAAIGGGDTP
jgi:hypothetical protein